MKKLVGILAAPGEVMAEEVRIQLSALRDTVALLSDYKNADIILVFLTPEILKDIDLHQSVLDLFHIGGATVGGAVVIPILARHCDWEREFRDLAKRQSAPRKWMADYGILDEATLAVAEMVERRCGVPPQITLND